MWDKQETFIVPFFHCFLMILLSINLVKNTIYLRFNYCPAKAQAFLARAETHMEVNHSCKHHLNEAEIIFSIHNIWPSQLSWKQAYINFLIHTLSIGCHRILAFLSRGKLYKILPLVWQKAAQEGIVLCLTAHTQTGRQAHTQDT